MALRYKICTSPEQWCCMGGRLTDKDLQKSLLQLCRVSLA
uniref:Uncharacterized protein n=1 Tax=Anguilla anguilla TaxID=7936 RepID=A0A0E9V2C3_ANGAN